MLTGRVDAPGEMFGIDRFRDTNGQETRGLCRTGYDGDLAHTTVRGDGTGQEQAASATLRPYGVFLREVAGVVHTYAERVTAQLPQSETTSRIDEKTDCAEAALDRFREHVRGSAGDEPSAALGSLLLAGHRLLLDLAQIRKSAAGEQIEQ